VSEDLQFELADEAATLALGGALAAACADGAVIYLRGDLGMGKTTLARGLLTALGHRGAVKSPTYTLVETYALPRRAVHHFDLYRLRDPEELEFMGIRDYFDAAALALIEWPQRGAGLLPEPDILVDFQSLNEGRLVSVRAGSARGDAIVHGLMHKKNSNIR
jgi:tRNA threonylcarbamoyladenosine biosynthesis protein TsaE